MEIQTDLTLNAAQYVSKDEVIKGWDQAYTNQGSKADQERDREAKKTNLKLNFFSKMFEKFLLNKKDKLAPMAELNAIKLINALLDDKLNLDLEYEKSGKPLKELPHYALDHTSMKFGLKTIAIKNLICMKEGLASATKNFKKVHKNKISYSMKLLSIFDLDAKPVVKYDADQIQLILMARPLWTEAQEIFKKNLSRRPNINMSDFSFSDLQTGGVCSALDVIDVFTTWCSKDKDLLSGVLPNILPDLPLNLVGNKWGAKKFCLDFSMMRICQRVSKMGKDLMSIFNMIDDNDNVVLEPIEILKGLTEKFSIYYSMEQIDDLVAYLDEDKSGDVSLKEFKAKISFDTYQTKYHLYTITFNTFIEVLLDEWKEYKFRTYSFFLKKFNDFDENGDGVLSFEEFVKLINNLEKDMDVNEISTLF